MFEMMIAEKLITDMRATRSGSEFDRGFIKPIQARKSLSDRLLPILGQAMVNAGQKLMDRSGSRIAAEQAHAPNFLIML